MAGPVEIRPCPQPRRFLRIASELRGDDPDFVPPLYAADAATLDPRRNPFFEHAEVGLFEARRGGRSAGRISVTRDAEHDRFHGDAVGFFGHFEAADAAVAGALLEHAASWLAERGAATMRGPVELSTNYSCGLLVAGAPGPPVVRMPQNPPEHAAWIEAAGLAKAKDLLALRLVEDTIRLDRVGRLGERVRQRHGITTRPIDRQRFHDEVDVLWRLYNRIWERNWGFAPMSQREFLRQARGMRPVLRPEIARIAEKAGEPVGFVVALPDINVAIRACHGRLLPFGWWRFMRALRSVRLIRVLTLGVVPEMRGSGLDAVLLHDVASKGMRAGFVACEASWILEDNLAMLKPLESLGAEVYRRYRIYERPLAAAARPAGRRPATAGDPRP